MVSRIGSIFDKYDHEAEAVEGGIILEGDVGESRLNPGEITTLGWKELHGSIEVLSISDLFDDLASLEEAHADDLFPEEEHKVYGTTKGVPKVFYMRPDELCSEAGYVVVWAEEYPKEVITREAVRKELIKESDDIGGELLRKTNTFSVIRTSEGIKITTDVGYPKEEIISERVWNQLKNMSDSEFDNSIVLELGVGAFETEE